MIGKLMRMLGMQSPRSARLPVDAPVEFGTGVAEGQGKQDQGRVRDLSATGIYFEAENLCAVDTPIHFTVELVGAGGASVMHCSGVIVRREALGNQKIGYGVRIDRQRIQPKYDPRAVAVNPA